MPTVKANNPKNTMSRFFVTINDRDTPDVTLQNTQVSIKAGNMRPRADKHSAPTKDMIRSKLGIMTASKTEKEIKKTLMNFKEMHFVTPNKINLRLKSF